MKKSILLLLVGFSGFMNAQIPTGYYSQTTGLTGFPLKTKLRDIVTNGHQDKNYNWVVFATADRDKYYENDNSVLDIYSENPTGVDPYNNRNRSVWFIKWSGRNLLQQRTHNSQIYF